MPNPPTARTSGRPRTRPAAHELSPEESRLAVLDSVPESAFLQSVVDYAALNGWTTYHTHDSRRSQAGFPDLVLVRGGVIVFAELKTMKGRPTEFQRHWLGELGRCQGVTVVLWRPVDWDNGEIERVLGRKA